MLHILYKLLVNDNIILELHNVINGGTHIHNISYWMSIMHKICFILKLCLENLVGQNHSERKSVQYSYI